MRTIRHYSNRKLYDTQESHYVTLTALAAFVRQGEDIMVVDKETGRDLTAATLAQIILEEERLSAARMLPEGEISDLHDRCLALAGIGPWLRAVHAALRAVNAVPTDKGDVDWLAA